MQSEPDPFADHFARLRRRFAEKNPLIAAILDGDTASALQAVQADPAGAAAASCCGGFGALHAAVVANDAELVAALCSAGVRDSTIGKFSPQTLMQLSGGKFANEEILQQVKDGRTALVVAMRMHRWPAVDALLAGLGGTPRCPTLAGNALLAVAHLPSGDHTALTEEERTKLVQRLLEAGADPLEQLAVPPSMPAGQPASVQWDPVSTPLFKVCAGAAHLSEHSAARRQLESLGRLMLEAALQRDQQADRAQQKPLVDGVGGEGSGSARSVAAYFLDRCQLAHALYAALYLGHQGALEHFLGRAEAAAPAAAAAAATVASTGAATSSAAASQPSQASGHAAVAATPGQHAVHGCVHGVLSNALQLAAGQLNERAVRVLVRMGAHGSGLSDAALLQAAQSGNQAILQLLAAAGARHECAVMHAARRGTWRPWRPCCARLACRQWSTGGSWRESWQSNTRVGSRQTELCWPC
ncbi:hypothetical protein ABPG75_011401 [Micractinium tetrahymenae]